MFVSNTNTTGAQANKGWKYEIFNGRVESAEIPLQKGRLDLSVLGYNLFDRKYRSYGIDGGSQLGVSGNQYGNPRSFGLGLNHNFTAS